jgi:hypothetical protein
MARVYGLRPCDMADLRLWQLEAIAEDLDELNRQANS